MKRGPCSIEARAFTFYWLVIVLLYACRFCVTGSTSSHFLFLPFFRDTRLHLHSFSARRGCVIIELEAIRMTFPPMAPPSPPPPPQPQRQPPPAVFPGETRGTPDLAVMMAPRSDPAPRTTEISPVATPPVDLSSLLSAMEVQGVDGGLSRDVVVSVQVGVGKVCDKCGICVGPLEGRRHERTGDHGIMEVGSELCGAGLPCKEEGWDV